MSDTNWQSYYGDNPDTTGFVNPPNPKDFDDIMKFSDCTHVCVSDRYIRAGSENCIDAVRGSNYVFRNCDTEDGAGVSTFTIKGAIEGWSIKRTMIGRARKTEIEVGQFDNYWKPGRKPTRRGLIELCERTDGEAIRVTCWDAEPPTVVNSNVKIRRVPWIIWFPYFYLRFLTIRKG